MSAAPPKAYVTGLAAIAANGADTASYWRSTVDGVCGLRPLARFDAAAYPVRVAGEAPGFVASDGVDGRMIAQTDRWTQLALVAGDRALSDAGLDPATQAAYSMAVVTGSSSGGNEFGQVEIERLWRRGPEYVGPYQSIAWFYAATTGQLSIRHGMKGPCGVVVAEQAAGLDALGQARRVMRRGASVVLTGGTEAPIGPYAITCQLAAELFSTSADPRRCYLPFDVEASGYVPGEGGAILVMESEESVRARRPAHVYGEVAGYAATFAPDSDTHRSLCRAIGRALADAEVRPEDIDVVFADAMAVPRRDAEEAEALADVFGPYGVPVTAPKSMVGRLYAGGSALDVATALLAMRDGVIPPTAGSEPSPTYQIDLVTTARPAPVRTALVLARGYRGFTSALVLRAPQASDQPSQTGRR